MLFGGSNEEKYGDKFFINNTIEAIIQGLMGLHVPLNGGGGGGGEFQFKKKVEMSPKEGIFFEAEKRRTY